MNKVKVGCVLFVIFTLSIFKVTAIEYFEEPQLQQKNTVKLAFLADIHLHDIFAPIAHTANIKRPTYLYTQQSLLIRSMYSQLHSTRLFNENYFVFIQALNELAAKNIKLVALPGDFTDDGQPINVKALARVLRHYEIRYGMRFFAIPGNHDPVKPFSVAGGKADFLAANGKEFGVYSHTHKKCLEHQAVCDDGLKLWGYKEILTTLNDFGFSQHKDDVLYETPYKNSAFSWCDPKNSKRCVTMADASYLVEPIEGVWLLAIDANVYAPQWENNPVTFKGSSGAGYNALIQAKPALLSWIKSVVKRAKTQNKALVAFSHFPMGDFYDGANEELHKLFSQGQFSLPRVPTPSTAKTLAETGLTLHFAGHMHLNDTALITANTGSQLVNVQVPSLAAYKAAYKVAELDINNATAKISTHTLENVPNFNNLFSIYETEWQFRNDNHLDNFDRSILASKNYNEFTKRHLFGLIQQRFLKRDWPKSLATWLNKNNDFSVWFNEMQCLDKVKPALLQSVKKLTTKAWLHDFYLLRNGDVSADVSTKQRVFYQNINTFIEQGDCNVKTPIQQHLALLIKVMAKFSTYTQGERFTVDLTTGEVT
ncbi:metallophosphoesterase [Pseudoalteromonas sp. MMG010]|uniref:metallophosphoesterase family protein n=1 Tax=Pseudoalteromonas sp. MMG010 TaxID=2822685 RepID=UPI001B3A7108|nr:metallophosphoesterase [Pseudoalteromonas sp. MMG010]MBQ4833568.1 metallophosphoesterase [Pseudoalteromonas sp. MMG010]